MSKDVAKKESTDVAFAYGEYEADTGFENQTQEDITIPFVHVLQPLSKAVDELGHKAGALYNSVTTEALEEIEFVPCKTQHVYVEWVPLNDGGGFVGTHEINSPVVLAAKEASTEYGKYTHEGNELVETFYVYGITCKDGQPEMPVCIAFTSTKIPAYKKWNTMLSMFTVNKRRPPLYAHLTKITTKKEEKNGHKYHNIVMGPANNSVKESLLAPDDPRFTAAFDCLQMVKSGDAVADYNNQNMASGDAETSDTAFDDADLDAPF